MSVILNQFQKVFEDFFLYMGTTSFVTSNFLIQTKKKYNEAEKNQTKPY